MSRPIRAAARFCADAYVSHYAYACSLSLYKGLVFSPRLPILHRPVLKSVEPSRSVSFHSSVQPYTASHKFSRNTRFPIVMAAKKRCQFQVDTVNQCSSAALRIVGECGHCQAQFCGSVSTGLFSLKICSSDLIIYSIDFLNITIAPTWRTAASRHLTGTNRSWRVSAQWLPRWLLRSFYTTR